ncbi:MAG: sigma-70 family RNA polymerase sigma factor [Lachnospiraceae bacterium]|nr:sigma-70 family RNA polymerase sigma factor [Lachnospiraceae bacterium]
MQDYEKYTDEELIVRIRDGENEISDYIITKYKNLVRGKVKSMYLLGGDMEDLIQEGMIGLYKAIRDYDAGRDASFFTFADICVSRQVFSAIEKDSRKKHGPLNTSISLDVKTGDGESGESVLASVISSVTDRNPEEIILSNELVERVYDFIRNQLTGVERQVIELYITGLKISEIAKVLSRDEKSTDNALWRAKNKIKNEFLE